MTTDFNLLRSRLENERKRLLDELAQLQTESHDGDEKREGSPFGKREEEATEAFELEKRLALDKQLKDQLAEVEYALKKFAEGTYGLCDECHEAIAPERLDALPQANLCLKCKAQQAKNAKGRPSSG